MSSITLKENEIVEVDGKQYRYNSFYQRLELLKSDGRCDDESPVVIMCPCCHATKFTIGYGHYECIATCDCGHSMTVYDG